MRPKKRQKLLTQHDILRKIEKDGVNSAQQYQMIIQNLQRQNIKLMQDREQLKIRVDILLQKQKQLIAQQSLKARKNPSVDYNRLKKQLQDKYIEFGLWQKKVYNSVNKGALNIQLKDHLNKCALIQAQIYKYRRILYDEKRTFKNLQNSLKGQLKYMNKNVPQKQLLEQQNKQLRRMIWNLRIVEDLTGHVEVRLHNSIVSLQNKKRFVQKLKTMTIQEIRRQQAKNKLEIIDQQIKFKKARHQSLRRLKTQSKLSQHVSRQQLEITETKQKQIEQKEQQKAKLQGQLQILLNDKSKLLQQKQKIEQRLQQLENKKKRSQQKQIQLVDVNLQVNIFEDQDPLPFQIIGNETFLMQNDRLVLKTSKDTLITGLIVYQNKIGIASIRALYSNGKQTQCLPPEKYLVEKCKHKKVVLNDPKDYLKWFKVFYDKTERKIVRIQIYSNNKIKFEAGKQKQLLFKNTIPYKFDNNTHQVPVCLKTSYQTIDDQWVVSSLAIEINVK